MLVQFTLSDPECYWRCSKVLFRFKLAAVHKLDHTHRHSGVSVCMYIIVYTFLSCSLHSTPDTPLLLRVLLKVQLSLGSGWLQYTKLITFTDTGITQYTLLYVRIQPLWVWILLTLDVFNMSVNLWKCSKILLGCCVLRSTHNITLCPLYSHCRCLWGNYVCQDTRPLLYYYDIFICEHVHKLKRMECYIQQTLQMQCRTLTAYINYCKMHKSSMSSYI